MKKIIAMVLSLSLVFVLLSVLPQTSATSEQTAFCDWTGRLSDMQTEGWTSPHNKNIKDTSSAVTVSDGVLSYNTVGMNFDCVHLQVSCSLNKTAVRNAIAAAKATDGQLYVTFSVKRAKSSASSSVPINFKLYCYADGDWQHAVNIVDGSQSVAVRSSKTFQFDVNKLEDMIPDTVAINAANYNSGITDIYYTVSSITAGGQQATYTTQDYSDILQKKKYEDYGSLIDHHLLGDLNFNNEIDLFDIRQFVIEIMTDKIQTNEFADVDENGSKNILDAMMVMEHLCKDTTPVHRPVTTDGAVNYNAVHERNDKGNFIINGKEYTRIFNDEFEGNSLDKTKWDYCPQDTRCNGQDIWRRDMVSLDGKGDVVLSCAVDEDNIERAKSGAIRTRDKFYSSYGYYECRVLLQQYSPCFWGAFWLMPDNIDNGHNGGSDGTEIDIFESAYHDTNKVQQGIHYDGYSSRHKTIGQASAFANLYKGYHTIGFSWDENTYKFYIDGKLSYQLRAGQDAGGIPLEICTIKEYLKLSVESADYWGGLFDPSDTPNNIDGITVDYVRVYELAD